MREADPPAVVFGGETIGLSIARSLGRKGVPVYAVGDPVWDGAASSRYCVSFTSIHASEGREEDRWLHWLATSGPRGAVLMPSTDGAVSLVARHRAELLELGYVPFEANDEVALAMLDKKRTYELAREAGVATPKTVSVEVEEDVVRAIDEVGFPCALKPVHSHVFARHFGIRAKAFVVQTPEELREQLERTVALELAMLVTEIVPGDDDRLLAYSTYLAADGEPLFEFTRSKVRQYPPGFGIGCYQVTRWDPEVAELGLRFFREIGLRGLAAIEFKRDPRDGRPKLIECNHRFTTATELTRIAGIDLPALAYDRYLGRPVPRVGSFREGVRMWNPIEDTRSFVESRRRGDLSFGRWAASLLHRQHFPVLRLSDLRPALVNYRRMARRALRGPARERRDTRRRGLPRA